MIVATTKLRRLREEERGKRELSETCIAVLNVRRCQIATREADVEKVVLQARQGSDRRVRATSGKCSAENELEEALLELTVLKERGRASAENSSKTIPLMKKNISAQRLHLLAASPPFILALEQALVTVVSVDQATGRGLPDKPPRWRSTLKRLMKDVSDGIEHFKQLQGRENYSKEVVSELTLAAASAQRLSLHVNAWTTPQLSQELERIWLQAVRAEARVDPQFQQLVAEWERACEALEKLVTTTHAASVDGQAEQDAVGAKILDCQRRAGIEPKVDKAGWWKQRQRRFLCEELRHIEQKVAPLASPSRLAARYNLLLARCAEAGAWTTAVSAYRSTRSRGVVPKDVQKKRESGGPFSLEPFVYQHLLRAAKNASPPQPRAAMLVLREMRIRGEEPTAAHYNLVVCACARAAAVAASTSALKPLEKIARGADGGKSNGMEEGTKHSMQDVTCDSDIGAVESVPLVAGNAILSTSMPLNESPSAECADDKSNFADDDKSNLCSLSAGSKALELRRAEHARGARRLALEAIADMRKRGIAPTEVTFKTLVECCRSAAAAPSPKLASDGEEGEGSSPAEVYAELKEAGVPLRFCYQAGLRNALNGGRRFPEYVAEMSK